MLKLYGSPLSNYCGMVRMALLEKGVQFEEVATWGSQEADFLQKSPMGKIPCLETPDGFLSETQVIMDYIEESVAGPRLYPESAYERAKVRELMRTLELYIELPIRRCFGEVFAGAAVSEETKAEVRVDLQRGMQALRRLAKFKPYVCGSSLTYADFVFMYSVNIAEGLGKQLFGLELLADLPKARELLAMLNDRPHAKTLAQGFGAALQAGASG